MAWFSNVSLGNLGDLADLAGAVNKISESVMNMEANFDTSLGFEDFLSSKEETKPKEDPPLGSSSSSAPESKIADTEGQSQSASVAAAIAPSSVLPGAPSVPAADAPRVGGTASAASPSPSPSPSEPTKATQPRPTLKLGARKKAGGAAGGAGPKLAARISSLGADESAGATGSKPVAAGKANMATAAAPPAEAAVTTVAREATVAVGAADAASALPSTGSVGPNAVQQEVVSVAVAESRVVGDNEQGVAGMGNGIDSADLSAGQGTAQQEDKKERTMKGASADAGDAVTDVAAAGASVLSLQGSRKGELPLSVSGLEMLGQDLSAVVGPAAFRPEEKWHGAGERESDPKVGTDAAAEGEDVGEGVARGEKAAAAEEAGRAARGMGATGAGLEVKEEEEPAGDLKRVDEMQEAEVMVEEKTKVNEEEEGWVTEMEEVEDVQDEEQAKEWKKGEAVEKQQGHAEPQAQEAEGDGTAVNVQEQVEVSAASERVLEVEEAVENGEGADAERSEGWAVDEGDKEVVVVGNAAEKGEGQQGERETEEGEGRGSCEVVEAEKHSEQGLAEQDRVHVQGRVSVSTEEAAEHGKTAREDGAEGERRRIEASEEEWRKEEGEGEVPAVDKLKLADIAAPETALLPPESAVSPADPVIPADGEAAAVAKATAPDADVAEPLADVAIRAVGANIPHREPTPTVEPESAGEVTESTVGHATSALSPPSPSGHEGVELSCESDATQSDPKVGAPEAGAGGVARGDPSSYKADAAGSREKENPVADSGSGSGATGAATSDTGPDAEAEELILVSSSGQGAAAESAVSPPDAPPDGLPSSGGGSPPPDASGLPPFTPSPPSHSLSASDEEWRKSMEHALQSAARQAQTKADELARVMTLNDELKAELISLKASQSNVAEVDALREEYQHRLGASERKVYALTKERDMLRREQSRKSDTTALLKEKDEIIKQVMAEGEELSKKQAAQEAQMKKLRLQLREMEEEKNRLTSKLQIEEARIESLRRDKAATEKALADAVDKGQAELAAQKDFYSAALSQARSALADAESRADSVAAADGERRLKEAGERERALLDAVEEMKRALERTEHQASMREQFLRKDVEELEKRCQDAEARHADLVARMPESTRPLLRQIEAIQESTNMRVEALTGVERALNVRLQEAEAKAAAAAERERAANERLTQTLSRMAVMEAQLSCVRSEQSQLSRSLEKERQRAAETRAEVLAAKERVAVEEGKRQRAEEEVKAVQARLQKEIAEEKRRREDAEKELKLSRANAVTSHSSSSSSGALPPATNAAPPSTSPPSATQGPSAPSLDPSSIIASITSPRRSISASPSYSELPVSTSTPSLRAGSSNRGGSLYSSSRRPEGMFSAASLEQLEAMLRQKEGEVAAYATRINSLESTRDSLAEDLVKTTTQCEMLRGEVSALAGLRAELESLQRRHASALELMGERDEQVEELRADLADVKQMYREQIDMLVSQIEKLGSSQFAGIGSIQAPQE